MKLKQISVQIISLVAVSSLSAQALAEAITCESKGDTRKLEIIAEGEGCKLDYTKAGAATTVATQKKGDEKCKEVSDKIKAKLEAAGYVCK